MTTEQARAALHASEERFRLLFEHAPDPMYLNDIEGRLVDGNQAAEELLCYRRDELIGRDFLEIGILAPDELPRVMAAVSLNLEGKLASIEKLRLLRKDGEPVLVDVRAIPVTIRNRAMVLGIARDITEQTRVEQQRQRLEERLRQAQKMEAVGQLAGGIAHELNNPLGTILGFAQSVCKQLDDDHPLGLPLKSIEREARRCRDLVDELLTFSNQSSESREPIALAGLLQTAGRLAGHRRNLEDIEVRIDNRAGDAQVLANLGQMEHVLVNLISNACDAMSRGGILTITGRVRQEWAVLEVSDTGLGVPEDLSERIFEPFYTTKELGGGTGLGLSTAYQIIKQHNGTIACQSSPGQGATFTITLPVHFLSG